MQKEITKIRSLIIVLAIMFSLAFVDGFLGIGFSDNFYVLVGLVDVVVIVWALIAVNKIID